MSSHVSLPASPIAEQPGDNHRPTLAARNGGVGILDGDDLRKELERLAAANRELLSSAGLEGSKGAGAPAEADAPEQELTEVRAENGRLRTRIEQLELQLVDAAQEREATWAEHQKEYEALLEEKSEVIRGLHVSLQELRQQAGDEPAAPAEGAESSAQGQELETLREQLEKERRQLREDEQAVEEQMKQMELAMSRERVEIARQRTELQRLQNDLKHELELAVRDAALRERLAPLQRRHQEIVNSRGASSAPPARPASSPQLNRPAAFRTCRLTDNLGNNRSAARDGGRGCARRGRAAAGSSCCTNRRAAGPECARSGQVGRTGSWSTSRKTSHSTNQRHRRTARTRRPDPVTTAASCRAPAPTVAARRRGTAKGAHTAAGQDK
jgi:hypothetical protein